ncbi:MAG TPA: glycosyltransferase family 2 protein [Acidimicrobiales bacterium]|nr:glycosyltransferase family 2 protein [Acidimicrobiales bacterium]
MKLSILMPVYNEAATLNYAVKRVLEVSYPCDVELVMVDDGSTDGSAEIVAGIDDPRVVRGAHPSNRGKGAALETAAGLATGDYVIICDADLEYSPADIPKLLAPVIARDATVVFGTRTFGSHTAYSFWYVVGNWGVTMVANVLYNSWLSDIETCFKLMPLSMYKALDLKQHGFGVEAEITGKLLKAGIRPYEAPVSYKARGREEGKKLTWRDGVEALWILAQIRFGRNSPPLALSR